MVCYIIKAFKKEIYYGKIEIIIIFDNINKIDEYKKFLYL